MSQFTFRVHINGVETSVTAQRWGRGWVVRSDGSPTQARSQAEAIRRASEVVGPVLAKAQSSGAVWGLAVSVGGAEALFGEWIPVEAVPSFVPDPPTRKSQIQRIYQHWQRHDGSPLGALEAACKIVEIYIDRPQSKAA